MTPIVAGTGTEENPEFDRSRVFIDARGRMRSYGRGNHDRRRDTEMQKPFVLTAAVVVLVAVAAAASLFALSAINGSHQTCGKVNQADLRAAGASDYGKKLEQLARCEG
jgi:hypothetical protein